MADKVDDYNLTADETDDNTSASARMRKSHHDSDEDVFVSHDSDEVDNSTSIVGEFDEEESEDIVFSTAKCESIIPLPVSKELKKVMDLRINIIVALEKMEKERQDKIAAQVLDDGAKNAYMIQSAELRHMPSREQAEEKKNSLEMKIGAIRSKIQQQNSDPEYPADEKIAPPSKELEEAWAMAIHQHSLFIQHGEAQKFILRETEKYYREEPLFHLLDSVNYPARNIFSFSIYQLGLENWQSRLQEKRKEAVKGLTEIEESSKGFFNKKKKSTTEEKQKLEDDVCNYNIYTSCISREIHTLQKNLTDEFWKLYEFCACLLVSGKIPEKRLPIIRSFLRYGLLGHAPWFISPEIMRHLLTDCSRNIKKVYDPAMAASNVVYADEYISFIVDGSFTPSIDENLELTARNTAEWSADKALRRIAYSRTRSHTLREMRSDLVKRIIKLRKKQDEMVETKSKLLKTAKDYKKRNAELAQNIQHCKVESARFERIVTRIDEKEIPELIERANMAKDRLTKSGVTMTAFNLARKESNAIHRVSRLCAKLKDPFLPFVLRDNYKLDSGVTNSREEIQNELKSIERADRNIFNEILVNSRKASQRLHMRYHPVFLITPSCGFLGYSWNPRVGVETGKLVFPGYCPRPGLRDRMLYNMLADFRWDTSKAAAGVDLLTSDTLVAAYSTVRWDYRKKKRENREKALIFNELNDRQNWRRHYEIYLQSAEDSGRKLFYKNYEVYEVVIKYIGLAEGKERLKH